MNSALESRLQDLGLQKIRRINNGYIACCPFHDDNNPSFSISDNGLWLCFSCDVRGNFKQLLERLGVQDTDWRATLRMLGIELQPRNSIIRKDKKVVLPIGFKEYESQDVVPAFISNRIVWKTIQRFKLGYVQSGNLVNRCIIPMVFRGKVVGYQARDVTGQSKLRYINPSNFEMKSYLFNFDGCETDRELFVVEGPFGCMSMVEKGFKNIVATFGTKFTSKQVGLIFEKNPSEVIICFDRDSGSSRAGQKASVSLGKMLNDILSVSVMILPFDKDPNDLPQSVLQECYTKRIKFDRLLERMNGNTNKR